MNTLYPIIKPLADAWNRYLGDPYMKDLEEFTAGGYAHDWASKAIRSDQHKYMGKYHSLQKRFKESPELYDVLEDNIFRLVVLSGFDRLLTLRQAHGSLKYRFTYADNHGATFQQMISREGLVRGYLKGSVWNLFHFGTTQFHALFYSRGTNYFTHFLYSSLIELVVYPLDTIKTILQSDTQGRYKNFVDTIDKTYKSGGLTQFYRGVLFKLLFNGALIFNLRSLYEKDYSIFLSYPLLAASYALLTIKTRFQLANTELTYQDYNKGDKLRTNIFLQNGFVGLYRGLIPFLLLNTLFHYNLYALYSPDAQKHNLDKIIVEMKQNLKSPRRENIWS